MKYNNEISLLEKLPVDILVSIFNLISKQEKIDTILLLRLVCKKLKETVSSADFLKKVDAQILNAKFLGLGSIVDKDQVMQNQIQDWQETKLNVTNIYKNFYNNLTQIKEIEDLINQIKQTSLPLNHYTMALKTIFLRPKVILALVVLLIIVIASVSYSVVELPKIEPTIARRNQLRKELIAEGCTFESGSHGSQWVSKCNDTVKANQWTDLDNAVFKYIFGPVILDAASGVLFLGTMYIGILIAIRTIKNQPKNYEDLSSANLYTNHHVLLTNIRNKFPNLNPVTPNIRDIRIALEKLLEDKDLPTDIADQTIINLGQEYLALIKTIDAELKNLEENKKDKKLIMSSTLLTGEAKASFRGKIYTFFARCHAFEQQQSAEVERILTHKTHQSKPKQPNEQRPLLDSQERDENTQSYTDDKADNEFRLLQMI